MSVKYVWFKSDLESLIFEDGWLTVDDGTERSMLQLTPEAAISLASKLLQYGTQAYRYPKKSDD